MADERGRGGQPPAKDGPGGSDQGADGTPPSLLPYDRWMEESLRGVVRSALDEVERNGLPGDHHFYISFRTDAPGVSVPKRLLAQYPQEITIVLQHQYAGLSVDETGFSVKLWFGGIPTPLVVPFAALTGFADPHVRFGLRFTAGATAPALSAPEPTPEPQDDPDEVESKPAEPPQVVSLDAFRKRQP